jgi:FtsZ-interacting cell division protein ZipA
MRTIYKVGDFVKPDSFDPDLDEVCTNGIHYFLTLKAAIGYKNEYGYCIIDGHRYDEDGKIFYC